MWNSTNAGNTNGTSWIPNQNGVKIDEIKCCGIPVQQCTTKKVLLTSTANYPDNPWLIFYDYTPRTVVYNGKTVYVYNPIAHTQKSLAAVTANPTLVYQGLTKFTHPFQFIDSRLNATNSTTIFNTAGVTRVTSKLLCYTKTDGTEQCQYNDAHVGYPVFSKTPSTGQATDVIYATTRDDPGFATYARADIVRAFDVQECSPLPNPVQVGACCPSGFQWDSEEGTCISLPVP